MLYTNWDLSARNCTIRSLKKTKTKVSCRIANAVNGGYEMRATVQLYLEGAKQGANRPKKHVARTNSFSVKHWLTTTTLSPMAVVYAIAR